MKKNLNPRQPKAETISVFSGFSTVLYANVIEFSTFNTSFGFTHHKKVLRPVKLDERTVEG